MDAEGEDHSLTLWLRRHLMVPTLCLGPICNVCLCAACGFDRRPMYTAQVVLFNWQRLQASRSHVFFHQFVPPPPLLLSSPSSSFPSPLPGFFCFILFFAPPILSLSFSLIQRIYSRFLRHSSASSFCFSSCHTRPGCPWTTRITYIYKLYIAGDDLAQQLWQFKMKEMVFGSGAN